MSIKRLFKLACRLLPGVAITVCAANAETGNIGKPTVDWALHGLNYANHRFSELKQIGASNVSALKPAWVFETGKIGTFQATPVVVNGVMYVSTPGNDVLALNAASGQEIWRYRHNLTTNKTCCGPANRGVAVAYGKVFMATIDTRLIALDQATGKVLWDAPITDPHLGQREVLSPLLGETGFAQAKVVGGTGYSANMAPQVYDGKVFVGITGAGYGLHLDTTSAGESSLSVVGLSGGGAWAAWISRGLRRALRERTLALVCGSRRILGGRVANDDARRRSPASRYSPGKTSGCQISRDMAPGRWLHLDHTGHRSGVGADVRGNRQSGPADG